jgi:hypothetical protein
MFVICFAQGRQTYPQGVVVEGHARVSACQVDPRMRARVTLSTSGYKHATENGDDSSTMTEPLEGSNHQRSGNGGIFRVRLYELLKP